MNKQQAQLALPLYADGELDSGDAADLHVLLERSVELRTQLEHWRALRRCARRVVSTPRVPAELETRVRAGLQSTRRARRYRSLRLGGSGLAIAATVMLAIGLWTPASGVEECVLATRCLAGIHIRCAAAQDGPALTAGAGREARAAQTELARDKAYQVRVPDLHARGFELVQACHSPDVSGVEIVHAFYRRSAPTAATVSLFSIGTRVRLKDCRCKECACRDGVHRDYEIGTYGDIVVYKWDGTANSFALCSDMPRPQLRELADSPALARLGASAVALADSEP